MEWGIRFIKNSLFVFNLIFAVSGVILIVAGFAIRRYISDFDYFIDRRILAPPIVLIATGIIVIAVTFLGCYGSIKENYYVLIVFAFALVAILIIELAIGIAGAVLKSVFQEALRKTMKKSLIYFDWPEYRAWVKMQTGLSCCGVDSWEDWVVANTERGNPSDQLLKSCCENLPEGHQCKPSEVSGDHSLIKKGCWESVAGRMENSASVLIGLGIGFAIIEIVGIIYACCLAMTITEEPEAN